MSLRSRIVVVAKLGSPRGSGQSPHADHRRFEGLAGPPRSEESRFSAFISYSRAVDGKLAPALQTALQRFAKPWYRMRGLRVFRDDASLSANPGLWSSIEEALDESTFFILLASPEARESRWVRKETEYWREHKPADRLLIALTDGAVCWDEKRGNFDWSRTALPETINGVFAEEPRYTDLRWARKEEHLTLDDPRFRSDVADIAASLHGRPKDEILGEDVRQHRRTIRLAVSAIVLFAALAAAAGLAALFAVNQRNQARAERDLATSRYLAAQAVSDLNPDLPRALLLSLEALRADDTAEARGALLSALQHKSPELLAFLEAHSDAVTSVAFSPDGKTLASGGDDGAIILWDAERRRPLTGPLRRPRDIATTEGFNSVTSVAFSPDGKTLASGGDNGTITLWDIGRRRPLAAPMVQRGIVRSLAFSTDGQTLAAGGGGLIGGHGRIILWDVERHRRLGKLLEDHPDGVESVAFSPDGKTLAFGSDDGTVSLWDIERRRPLATLQGHQDVIRSVAFSPDGKMLASGGWDRAIILWDAERRQPLATLRGHRDTIESVAFSPDGKTLGSGGGEGTVIVWDVERRQLVARLQGHRESIGSVAFSPDGRTLGSGDGQGTVIVWDVERQRRLETPLRGHRGGIGSVAFSPDGKTLASGSDDETIMLWGVEGRQPLGPPLGGDNGSVESVVFSPDGKTLASGSAGNTIMLWDVERRRPLVAPIRGERGSVERLAFSPDGQTLASGGMNELGPGSITLWDLERRRPLAAALMDPLRGHRQRVGSVAFSPDGKTLASGSDEGVFGLWDLERRRLLGTLPGHRDSVNSVAFSPDGKALASGSDDETIMLWDAEHRRPLATLRGHRDRVKSVAFSPDGKTLASGSDDGSIILWDAERRQRLAALLRGHSKGVRSVAFSPDGKTLASGGWDGTILLWDTSLRSWRARACELANRNLSKPEWDQYMGSSRPYWRTCPALAAGSGAPADAPAAP